MCCIVKCCNCHFISAGDMAGVACRGLVCVCVCTREGHYHRVYSHNCDRGSKP